MLLLDISIEASNKKITEIQSVVLEISRGIIRTCLQIFRVAP